MSRIILIKRRLGQSLPAGLAMLAIFYFGVHALTGSGSLKVLRELKAVHAELSTEAEVYKARRLAFEHRAAMLKSDRLDPDLLDELARKKLGLVQRDDMIVMAP